MISTVVLALLKSGVGLGEAGAFHCGEAAAPACVALPFVPTELLQQKKSVFPIVNVCKLVA